MKKFLIQSYCFIAALAAASGLASCSDEPAVCGNSVVCTDGELSIGYVVDGEMPLSRGMAAQTHEAMLDHAYILFFDADNEDSFVAFTKVEPNRGDNTMSFNRPENLENDHPYKLLAVGNAENFSLAPDFAEFLSSLSCSLNDMKGILSAYSESPVTRYSSTCLPLWGKYVDDNDEEITFQTTPVSEDKVKVVGMGHFFFSRAICRVDLLNLVGNVLEIKGARMVNNRNAGLYFIDGPECGDITPFEEKNFIDNEEDYSPVTTDMDVTGNTTQHIEGSLYTFPNIVNTSVVDDKVTTALLIAGYYTDPETGKRDENLTYYRFNLVNAGQSQVLQRNYCYRAVIKGVRRRGADTELKAYTDNTPVFEYDVDDEWEVTDNNVASDKDGNFLIVNRSHLTFRGEVTDADYVELRVSTNPGLTWRVERVAQAGEGSSDPDEYFYCERMSEQVIKCGALQTNDTNVARYGNYIVKATDASGKVNLSIPIYMMQLSSQFNVKTLTVNGYTGTFTQQLNPMGGTISLPVVTGSPAVLWQAEDDGNLLMSWDTEGVAFTKKGGNNSSLNITVPANLSSGTRTAKIIVAVMDGDHIDETVPKVTINLVQEATDQILDVLHFPDMGKLDIDCLSFEAGNENGVVNPYNILIRLTDARYRVKITSTFDKDRDLMLSTGYHCGPGTANEAKAWHPEGETRTDEIDGITTGTSVWINPFRTGPKDPNINGQITITAYNPDDPTAKTESRVMDINLRSDMKKVKMDDCFYAEGGNVVMIPDRNYGATGKLIEPEAKYYDSRPNVRITSSAPGSATQYIYPCQNVGYAGTIITETYTTGDRPQNGECYYTRTPKNDVIIQNWITENAVNEAYTTYNWWNLIWHPVINTLQSRCRLSKQRVFIVSAIQTQKDETVCCWLPYVAKHDDSCFLPEGCYYTLQWYGTCTWDSSSMRVKMSMNLHKVDSDKSPITIVANESVYTAGSGIHANIYSVARLAIQYNGTIWPKIKEIYGLK